jgi:predicted 3-demethylubiquinone-9 3-methyltransferase (glyoxalase superfamily)
MKNSLTMMVGLWFKTEAAEAANFYCSIFPNSKILRSYTFPPAVIEKFGLPENTEMGVDFSLNGAEYSAFNGNTMFNFSEAVSLMVKCDTQVEIDYYWEKLGEGMDPEQGQCGWMKDKFGITWQVVPEAMDRMMSDPDPVIGLRVFEAMMPMKKLNIAVLQAAYEGK